MGKFRTRWKVAISLWLGLACAPCLAQEQERPAPQTQLEIPERLDTIIVTAQRREENQQIVPVAVTSLSAEFLARNSINSLEGLSATVPGFVTTQSVNYAAAPLSIRGVGGANGGGNFFADEPVAVYLDEVYLGRLSFSTAALFDVDAIEVVRGPQGTLRGRNSSAGAVSIRSNRPGPNWSGRISTSVGSFNNYRIAGVINAPVADDLISVRIAGGFWDRDGYGTNPVDGSRVGGAEDRFARTSIRVTPASNFTLDIIGDAISQSSVPGTIAVADLSNPAAASPFAARPDLAQVLKDRVFASNDPNFYEGDHRGLTVKAHWDLGGVAIDWISAIRRYEFDAAQDSDGTALQLINNEGAGDNDQISQEIRLSSPDDRTFSWIAGALYFHEENDLLFRIRNFNGFFGLGTLAQFQASQTVNAYAAFAEGRVAISKRLAIVLGGRYSRETKRFANQLSVTTLSEGSVPIFPGQILAPGTPIAAPPLFEDRASFDEFSPRFVLEGNLADNLFAYASYSNGFNSGGFNAFGLAAEFESQRVDAYEIGVKSQLWQDAVRLNLSAFAYDYSDLQVRLPVPTGGVDIANVAQARILGAEAEFALMPARGLTVSGNASWLDTRFTQGAIPAVPEDLVFPIGAPIPLTETDITGNRLSRAPTAQLFGSVVYEFALGHHSDMSISAAYRYQSKVFFLETNQTQSTYSGDGFSEVGLQVSYHHIPSDLRVSLNGQNVFDTRRIAQVTALGAFPNAALNEPARWSIEIAKSF